jgi:hypothetical protein
MLSWVWVQFSYDSLPHHSQGLALGFVLLRVESLVEEGKL